jgi:UDP-glucuronate 4-epimerase
LRILVTGGAGFIGSHVIDRLVERGDEIACVDAFTDFYSPSIKRRNIEAHVASGAVRLLEGDICDVRRMGEVFKNFRPQKVVHFAARVAAPPSITDPLAYAEVNCTGTVRLLRLSVENDVRQFLFASSSSVYGDSGKRPFSEDDAADRPVSPYAATKRAGEMLCHAFHSLWSLPVTCLRLFTVYGPRQRPDMAIHTFARRMMQGKPIPRFGDGTSRRDYTYIADVVQGVDAALDRVFDYEIINLGESRTVSLNELIQTLENVTGRKATVEELPERPGDVRETLADISKARRLLGYVPLFPLEHGLEEFWTWYQENRKTLEG